jgi:hypothetical protein
MTRRHRLTDGREAIYILNWTDKEQSFTAGRDFELHMIGARNSVVACAVIAIPAMAGAVAVE